MKTITEYLEKSMKNCSLSDRRKRTGTSMMKEESNEHNLISETTLELNSHISLPYYWEQCLDLKTGEIYYINWKNGMRVKEDPRNAGDEVSGESCGSICSEEVSSYFDSENSSSESSPSSSKNYREEDEEEDEDVLVVAGCKACFMYFMVPKFVEDCPKCAAQLLHFDRPYSASTRNHSLSLP